MDMVRQAVSVLKQRLPETETWHAYSTLGAIFSGLLLQGHSIAEVTRVTNLGKAAILKGTERWMHFIMGEGPLYHLNKDCLQESTGYAAPWHRGIYRGALEVSHAGQSE